MRIREYLRQAGLTVTAFAAEVGVSEAAMSRYARGKRAPRPDVVRRIAAASGGRVQPNDLFEVPAPGEAASAPGGAAAGGADAAGYTAIDLMVPDLNGTLRGKRITPDALDKALGNHVRIPGSMFGIDITGENAPGSGLVWAVGDADRTLAPVDGKVRPVPWVEPPMGQLLMTMLDDDGSPYFADPRHALARVLRRFAERGLSPVVAVELEFYLIDRERDEEGRIQPPRSPASGRRERSTQVYGLDEIDAFAALFREVTEACRAQEVPAYSALAEFAPSQYEINLKHVADPLAAADHAVLLKRAVKGVARAHGLDATFMAKPFAAIAGNGMHLHVSLVDEDGVNVFDGGEERVNEPLRHALGGLLATMAEATAIFAPNANSYRRLQPGAYVPLAPTWGFENRTVALRVPGGAAADRRVEHRVAGADANPYLALAAVLAGIHHGLEAGLDPGERITGNAYEKVEPSLPNRWLDALDALDRSVVIRDYLGPEFCRLYGTVKRFERSKFEAQITPLELDWYLRAV